MNDKHKHRCPKCRTVWEHGEACANDDKAHTCPNCFRELPFPWSWYNGDEAAAFAQSCGTEFKNLILLKAVA